MNKQTEFEEIVGPVLPRQLDRQYVTEQILQALRRHTGSEDFAVVGGQVMRLEQRGSAHLGRHIHRNQAGTEHVVVTEWNLLGEPQFDCTEPDEWTPLYKISPPSERADQCSIS